jgi:hypothetical protein
MSDDIREPHSDTQVSIQEKESLTLNGVEKLSLPEGTKVIIPPEKITEKVKKERTQKQIEAFEKMRAKRLENDKNRKLGKEDKQKEIDNIKIQQEKEEEEERQRRAEELKEKLGVNVEVLKKRGRKAGQHIPYKQTQKSELSQDVEKEPPKPVHVAPSQPTYTTNGVNYSNPYMSMLLNKMRR